MLDRIRAAIPALPPAEQRVALLLLAVAPAFAALPVGELAARAAVSQPTVVRFCRSIGCAGLVEIKRKLAGRVHEGVPYVHRAVDDANGAPEIIVKVIDSAGAAMLRLRCACAAPPRLKPWSRPSWRWQAPPGPWQILLAADHPEDADRYSPMVAMLLHLLLVDILVTGVGLLPGSKQLRSLLQDIQRVLRQRRYVATGEVGEVDAGDAAMASSASGSSPSMP
ncbi:MAG: hypothetical protein M3Y32_04055 [Pseudomonadota bacterium]|nr:hypothetical protein [Pseudomonadota bacterium]